MRTRFHGLCRVAAISFLFLSRSAGAFCFETTCNSDDTDGVQVSKKCGAPNEDGCYYPPGAQHLHWESACLSFGVQRDGSKLRHITYETADPIIRAAYDQWLNAECSTGGHPSIKVWDMGPIVCDKREFNETEPNSNTWIFRDDDWPYQSPNRTLAFTSQIYDTATGAILDADVEINTHLQNITTANVNPPNCGKPGAPKCPIDEDLRAIATHEAGHFLGLAHSAVQTATMYKDYKTSHVDIRSLDEDDVDGICALYPPDREVAACTEPAPTHGFSRYCGIDPGIPGCSCRTVVPEGNAPRNAAAVAIVGMLSSVVYLRRRRPRRAAP